MYQTNSPKFCKYFWSRFLTISGAGFVGRQFLLLQRLWPYQAPAKTLGASGCPACDTQHVPWWQIRRGRGEPRKENIRGETTDIRMPHMFCQYLTDTFEESILLWYPPHKLLLQTRFCDVISSLYPAIGGSSRLSRPNCLTFLTSQLKAAAKVFCRLGGWHLI